MPPNLSRKLKTLALICLFTSIAGMIFQLINERRIDYSSILVGCSLGLVFGLLELFLFPKAASLVRSFSFTQLLLIKTLLYTAVIFLVTSLLTFLFGYLEGYALSELPAAIFSMERMILVLYSLIVYGSQEFLLQINHL